jgi:hypothetical protein
MESYRMFTYCTKKIHLAAILFLVVLRLYARDVEIIVEDTELGIPLEGAIVRSWDGQEYDCDADGKVLISVPDDRPVVIQAAYPGYESGRLVVSPGEDRFVLGLSLSGVMESRELVIEASRPGTNETRTGRSVAVSERDIAQTGEIGLIEDVMNTVKLLPGVGYAGFFNAQPSIRGGDPGDLIASLDGFYIENPYYWGGGYSIFDPRMVRSAQLSHGVFSARYGHTVSGLLEVSSKKPSPTETELELGLSTSAANLNLSFPFAGKGGIMIMGRLTYYEPYVWLAKQLAKGIPELEVINAVNTAPYIRSGIVSGNYRFSGDLELNFTGFWGGDGVGALYENSSRDGPLTSATDMRFDWENHQGFVIGGLSWNPRSDMLLKGTAGAGYHQVNIDADIDYDIEMKNNNSGLYYTFADEDRAWEEQTAVNVQGRLDYDWDLGKGFIFAAGVQELFSRWIYEGDYHTRMEKRADEISDIMIPPQYNAYPDLYVNFPLDYGISVDNHAYTTSAYSLLEYRSDNNKFGAELGLRVDHQFFKGKDFSVQTLPAFNPRLNLDFGVLKDFGIIDSLSLSAGTGLFSSMNKAVILMEKRYGIGDYELKPNRSWTSVGGAKIEFPDGLSLNIEGYYKYVFDRAYVPVNIEPGSTEVDARFDGEGKVWGFDLMLQKLHSRYWDGWISYSFSHAQYRDPKGIDGMSVTSGGGRGGDWYFPSYHRFHNINLILNVRPLRQFNISTRLGLASGVLLPVIDGDPQSYGVLVLDKDKTNYIEKWKRASHFDDGSRTGWSIPLDLKFSIYGFNKKGRVQSEVYIAVENTLALLYTAKGNTTYNAYTGEENTGSDSASYELPIPMISFGYKWSY